MDTTSLGSTSTRARPPLHRNQACRECRKRKVKCDAVKPVCSQCYKSATVYGVLPQDVTCTYPADTDTLQFPLQPGKRRTVAALEARILELERQVESQAATVVSLQVEPTPSDGNSPALASPASSSPRAWDPLIFTQTCPATQSSAPVYCNPILDMLFPGWPSDLPSPTVVTFLIDTFFRSGLVATRMINAPLLMTSLNLPPLSHDFPHPSLLHAICAVTATFVSVDQLGTKYWNVNDEKPSSYHAKCARGWVERNVGQLQGRKLLQVCQALHLVSLQSFSSANFLDAWNSIGAVMRLIPPLGLNHLDETAWCGTGRNCSKVTLLAPTTSVDDQLERIITFWQAFCCDRFIASCTGWAVALDDSDITTPLPDVSPLRHPIAEALDPASPTFFSRHSTTSALAPLQLAIKGAIILGRVSTFLQRFGKRSLASSSELIIVGREGHSMDVSVKESSTFKKLDGDLKLLRLSMARDYQLEQVVDLSPGSMPDPCLIGALLIPHAAGILLHEPFLNSPTDISGLRCHDSARSICSILIHCSHLGSGVVEFLSLAYPFVNFCWAVAGRTLAREVGFAMRDGNESRQSLARAEVGIILEALRPFASLSSLGRMCDDMIRSMMDNPTAMLFR